MLDRRRMLMTMALAGSLLPVSLTARTAWDPGLAAGVVEELLGSLTHVVELSEQDDEMQPDAVMSKNAHAALVDIRFVIEELEQLHLLLSGGRNKAQTYANYQRVSNLRDSISGYAAEAEISEDVRIESRTTQRLMRELDLIYL